MFVITQEMQLRSNLRHAMKKLFDLIAVNDLAASLKEMRKLEGEFTSELKSLPDNESAYCLINFGNQLEPSLVVALMELGKLKNNQFLDFQFSL